VLLTAATPGEAPAGLQSTGDPRLQELWTTLHLPALCLPCGTGPTGLPLSVQLIGRAYADTHLLGAARVAEAALGGRIAETA
jgi:amidase